MRKTDKTTIALLRGVNVGGHNKIPMAELRSLCTQLGWTNTRSYIQSGNLVFGASGAAGDLEAQLENAIGQHFGFSIPVIIRTAQGWHSISSGNPFPDASEESPNLVMLGLTKRPVLEGAETGLLKYAVNGERVSIVKGHLWVHFPDGSGRSKITPAVLDRVAGSTVTMRNWRTVTRLNSMASNEL